jgi:hypothetical protein
MSVYRASKGMYKENVAGIHEAGHLDLRFELYIL